MDAAFEYDTEGSVVVAHEICWCPVPGECFGYLLRQPLGGRMPGHREPQQLPPSVAENKKCEELFKGNRRNHKEINRSDDISVVAKEGFFFQVCNGRSFLGTIYFDTVDWGDIE